MSSLICGSIAYDNIMVFRDYFKNHIDPDQIHILNVSFYVPEMRRDFGGCAGNIAYNLKLLGDDPLIMATVGDDAGPYLMHLDKMGISRAHILQVANTFTAQAFITTDLDDNQITAFHSGAMGFSHLNQISKTKGVTLGIVAPDGKEGMIQHAEDFAKARIPFIFDLGQAMPLFSGEDLMRFMKLATYACFNAYEMQITCSRTGKTLPELAKEVEALIVTHGDKGSHIYADGHSYEIPCVEADAVIDPTGCGDAYRSGLLYGISRGWSWERTGQLASVMGAIKVSHRGCQNHRPSREEIAGRYYKAFGQSPW